MDRKPFITRFASMVICSPVIWGGMACLAFYALFGKNSLNNAFVEQYFESHPIEYVTTLLFFVGVAALAGKLLKLMMQSTTVGATLLEAIPNGGNRTEEAGQLLTQLDNAPTSMQNGYLVGRLRAALDYIQRKGSADTLDSQLHFLADEDYNRMQNSYAIVRIVIWAIPILGFLGTVVGITLAIGNMSPDSLESSLSEVVGGLSVAFDTTALALALSIFLMFSKFFLEQAENKLLKKVDTRINEEMIGRFQEFGSSNDPNIAAIRRASDAIIASTEELVLRQTQLWNESLEAANERWASLTGAASEVIETALAEAVSESLQKHATVMSQGIEKTTTTMVEGLEDNTAQLAEAIGRHTLKIAESTKYHSDALTETTAQHTSVLEKCLVATADAILEGQELLSDDHRDHMSDVQKAITDAANVAVEQQKELVKQGDILLKVVDATGQVGQLQDTLNDNLDSLASVGNFEETVTSLAAAIQLLSARLGQTQTKTPHIQLEDLETQPPAAA